MQKGFTKLFNSIITSTIWSEDDKTHIVWITMLALCDRYGDISASIPGLAKVANVSIEATNAALENLMRPDPYSRTKDHQGRRIVEIDGGWHVFNYAKYRDMLSAEERKEYKAKKERERRERVRQQLAPVD
jgi:hypothetical protein